MADHHWRSRAHRVSLALGVGGLTALVLMGCGSSSGQATTTTDRVSDVFTLRPVLAVTPGSGNCPTGGAVNPNPTGTAEIPQCSHDMLVATYTVGPVTLGGEGFLSARAVQVRAGNWVVAPILRTGAEGLDRFNAMAAACYGKTAQCPTGQLAMVLNALIVSAPTIQQSSFQADQIQISGDFTEDEAKALAASLDDHTGS